MLLLLMGLVQISQISLSYEQSQLKLEDLTNKAKNIYKNKFEKENIRYILGYDSEEYPRSNRKYRQINQGRWNDYYSCLNTMANRLGKHGYINPKAILGFPADSIKFKCNICLSPKERYAIDLVNWYWAYKTDQHYQPILYNEVIILAPKDKTLHIYHLQEGNSGQYICKISETLTVPFFLTVISKTINISEVHNVLAKKGPYAISDRKEKNYKLRTKWKGWSPCSNCDVSGRKHKLGYCEVKYRDHKTIPRKTSETTLTSNNTAEVRKQSDYIKILQVIPYGIPCRSHILPKSIRDLTIVKNRQEEVVIGYCKIKCTKPKLFELRDVHGEIIEKANNSEGIYSMSQDLPPPVLPVERGRIYGIMGHKLVITCPGYLNTDELITWQAGRQRIIQEAINAESNGRISITITNGIVIQELKNSDSNIYSCWNNHKLVGILRVIVEKKFEMQLDHHFMLISFLIIVGTYILVIVKAVAGRKYAKVIDNDP